MKVLLVRVCVSLLRLGLGGLFVVAGVAKLGATNLFAAQIVRLQLVPFSWAEWIAAILPVAELFTGVWLVSGWRPRAAALAAMMLASVFVLAVGQAVARGIEFECACFGTTAVPPSSDWVLARTLILLAAASLLRRSVQAADCFPSAYQCKRKGALQCRMRRHASGSPCVYGRNTSP